LCGLRYAASVCAARDAWRNMALSGVNTPVTMFPNPRMSGLCLVAAGGSGLKRVQEVCFQSSKTSMVRTTGSKGFEMLAMAADGHSITTASHREVILIELRLRLLKQLHEFRPCCRYGRNFACSPRCSRQNDLDDGSLAIERINLVPLGGLWPKKGVAPGAAPQRIRLKRFRESFQRC
jgi:hypothetical protein